MPTRRGNGEIHIEVRATQALVDAVRSGKDALSLEFYALKEARTAAGVREIQRAYMDAAALVGTPEYAQGRAEIRTSSSTSHRRFVPWL